MTGGFAKPVGKWILLGLQHFVKFWAQILARSHLDLAWTQATI